MYFLALCLSEGKGNANSAVAENQQIALLQEAQQICQHFYLSAFGGCEHVFSSVRHHPAGNPQLLNTELEGRGFSFHYFLLGLALAPC